jgi:hypothetical protein
MSAVPQLTEQQIIAEDLGRFTHDPLGAALYGFPWGEGDLEGFTGPLKWQKELFSRVKNHLSNAATRHTVFRQAVSSGHGIGKSAAIAQLVWWAKSTHEDCKVIITANTKGQLDTKTQPELKKWFRQAINADWWEVLTTAIKSREQDHAQTWRSDLIPWSEDNPQAFAGAHNKGKRLVIIFDEASEIAPIIWETIQGALTDSGTEILFFAFGNPTLNHGPFYEACFGNDQGRWNPLIIDSREVEITNKVELDEWEKIYGEDSDFFRVRVRGLAPSAAEGQYIDKNTVLAAQQRDARSMPDDPLVVGVDFAWGGADNNVIRARRGFDAKSYKPIKVKGEFTRDPMIMVGKLSDILEEGYPTTKGGREPVDMMFLDSAGIAGPIAARLRELGFKNLMEVNFGAESPHPKYAYFRDYMWGMGKEWLRQGAIDNDPSLSGDLCGPMLVKDPKQRVKLESKELIKKRIGRSTDDGDAWALTFAHPVKAKPVVKKKTQYRYPGQGATGWMG